MQRIQVFTYSCIGVGLIVVAARRLAYLRVPNLLPSPHWHPSSSTMARFGLLLQATSELLVILTTLVATFFVISLLLQRGAKWGFVSLLDIALIVILWSVDVLFGGPV
jgi:hypothetical protein